MALQGSPRLLLLGLVAGLGTAIATPTLAQEVNGSAVFEQSCLTCHTGAVDSRAPSPDALGQRSPEAILDVLMKGVLPRLP